MPTIRTCWSVFFVVAATLLSARGQTVGQRQSPTATKVAKDASRKSLVSVRTVTVPSVPAGMFAKPITCDASGNIYLHNDQYGVSGLHKLSREGTPLALFLAKSEPDFRIAAALMFSLATDGSVYQLVFLRSGDIDRYVLVYNPDGSFRARVRLQLDFAWVPSTFAVFPSGDMLVSGQAYDVGSRRSMRPFTAVFSSQGKLVREVQLADDEALRQMTDVGDVRVTSPFDPRSSRAIGFSEMHLAKDGNIYLMRWTAPAILYAISPKGEVVRRFTVDPGDDDYRPEAMHIASGRIALMFVQPQSREKVMKVLDLEGHDIATYGEPEKNGEASDELGSAFACYIDQPEHFIFLGADENDRLQFVTAEAR
jgi:hypothetical protein